MDDPGPLAADAQDCNDAPTEAKPTRCRLAGFVRSAAERAELERWAAGIGHELVHVYEATADHEGRWDPALVKALQRAADPGACTGRTSATDSIRRRDKLDRAGSPDWT